VVTGLIVVGSAHISAGHGAPHERRSAPIAALEMQIFHVDRGKVRIFSQFGRPSVASACSSTMNRTWRESLRPLRWALTPKYVVTPELTGSSGN
jgi:hypothetical protein